MQSYIGVKAIQGRPDPHNDGYRVLYTQPDGSKYESWSPTQVFEDAYFPFTDKYPYCQDQDLEAFISTVETYTVGTKTTVVTIKLITGFEITETSPALSDANYSEEVGEEIALKKCMDKLRAYMAFVVSWAKFGLDANVPTPTDEALEPTSEELEDIFNEMNKEVIEDESVNWAVNPFVDPWEIDEPEETDYATAEQKLLAFFDDLYDTEEEISCDGCDGCSEFQEADYIEGAGNNMLVFFDEYDTVEKFWNQIAGKLKSEPLEGNQNAWIYVI